ncbi:unnamed protein product [Diplocarpon coronariae]
MTRLCIQRAKFQSSKNKIWALGLIIGVFNTTRAFNIYIKALSIYPELGIGISYSHPASGYCELCTVEPSIGGEQADVLDVGDSHGLPGREGLCGGALQNAAFFGVEPYGDSDMQFCSEPTIV